MTEIVDVPEAAPEETAAPVDQAAAPEEAAAPVDTPAEPTAFTPEQEAMVRRLILDRDKQWEQYNQQTQPAAAPPQRAAESTDTIESEISALYTDDEAGRATRRSVETHFDLLLRKNGIDSAESITREDVERIAADRANMVKEQMRSGLSINDEVSDLVKRNVISVEDAEIVQSSYSSALSAPGMREAAENPKNAPWILKGVVYDLVKSGKVRPFSKRSRATNPLQPGGSGASPQPAVISDDPASSPFSSVRNLTKDQLAAARQRSDANYRKANG